MNPRSHLIRSLVCTGALAVLGALGATAHADEREAPPVREVQEIPLPGVQGRIDHFTIDSKRKRVIFSGLGNNSVQIVDVFAGRMVHQIDGLAEPQGTLYLAEWDKLFVANSANGHVNVYDGAKFALIDSIDFGEDSDPDNLRYDADAKKIYIGYGDGAIGVIDPATDKRLPTVYKLEAHPEGFQLESKGPRIFVNVADTKNIQVIDRRNGKVVTWSLPKGHSANFPMVLDEADRRVFVGTRKPSRLTVFDMDSGKVVASLPTAGDMDDMFYDSGRKRVYVAGGEGFLSVVQQVDADHYTDMGKFATALGTRTGVWYEKRDRLYIAAPPSGVLGARLLVFEAQTD
jgi:DNA-binding beta-propeller fold protein YncE